MSSHYKSSVGLQWWCQHSKPYSACSSPPHCPLCTQRITQLWPSTCWLLSKNLISQMEKQHLLSYSFTYGGHSCSHVLKQVCLAGRWPLGTLNRGPGPGDSVGPLCSEDHAVPSQMKLHMEWGNRRQRSRDHGTTEEKMHINCASVWWSIAR